MRERLIQAIAEASTRLLREAGDEAAPPEFTLEVPRSAEHGDFATNAAMLLAKRLRRPPREIAAQLAEQLAGVVARAEVAGPGFVNVWLAVDRWRTLLAEILRAGTRFGGGDAGKGHPIQVEFVSANPTGPLSVGHGRQAVLGDCIARLLDAAGWKATREYYFNNGGRQMRVLGESVKARYLELIGRAARPPKDALEDPELPWPDSIGGLPLVFPRDGYQGDYITDIAESIHAREGEGWLDEPGDGRFRQVAEATIFAGIRATLETLGVHFDVYFNETSLYETGKIEEVLRDLRASGLVYDEGGAVWLRATELGLQRDRVLVKSSGEPTYLLPDIAYHREKFRRGFERIVDVMGADHVDQVPFVRAALGLLGFDPERVELVMNQFVTLSSGGKTVKQSTRRATFITTDELVEEVGVDVFRFFMVERKAEGHLDFQLDLAKETDWSKNPAYYVQYAHARACGIERQAQERGVPLPEPERVDGARLALPEELELLRKLAEFPDLVGRAAEARAPHHVAYWLRELAGLWNPYVQDGKRHRVLNANDAALTEARLALTGAVRTVLSNGLGLLGMSAPERM
ncbi:MAG: arginine--tRNA ligase [Myxococcota bacterium]